LSAMQSNMPQGSKASATAVANMQAWITDGLLETASAAPSSGTGTGTGYGTGTAAGTAASTGPTYYRWVQQYLQSNCTVCHSATGQDPSVDLTTYASAVQNATSSLAQMKEGAMPQ